MQLMPSPSSRRQLFFSLTQPPARGAELALDDIVFRNCGLEGESHILWDELSSPGKLVWALHLGGALPLPTVSWGHLALARTWGG